MFWKLKTLLGWCDDDYGVSKFFNEKVKGSDLVNEKSKYTFFNKYVCLIASNCVISFYSLTQEAWRTQKWRTQQDLAV